MIYEIPGNIYNDYDSSNIAANTFKCKNMLNSTYDMEHTSHKVLTHARKYDRIDHCNKQVYMTYHDNIDYSNKMSNPAFANAGHCGIKCA